MSSRDGVHDAELYESITEPGNLLSWYRGEMARRLTAGKRPHRSASAVCA